MIKEWCETCEGTGYIEIPDYDWDENPIEPMKTECYECDGKGHVNTVCAACNGSGWYDNVDECGNPIPCAACEGTGIEATSCDSVVYVITSYYNDGDLERAYEVERPIAVHYSLKEAMSFCDSEGGYEVETHEDLELIKAYEIDECEYYKIYKVNIR